MTTAPGKFTSRPTRVAGGVKLTFDGVRLSAPEPDADVEITPETEGYWRLDVTTIAAVPPDVLDTIAGSVTIDRAGDLVAINQAQALPVLRKLIRPDDRRAFEGLVGDPDRVVTLEALWTAAMYAVEQLTGRPTGGSGD